MRLLIYGLNHAPEPTGIGKYTGEMVAWLAARGHDVRVVAAPPYYPAWRVAEGHSAWRWRRERRDGALVYRCPLYVPRRPRGATRLLHLASFAASSLPVALAQATTWRPQLVFGVAPALASAPGALLAARLCGARAWLHIQDFEVDAAFSLGLLGGGGRLRRAVLGAEAALLRRFDRVSTIAEAMVDRLAAKGVAAERRMLFRNWVDCRAIQPLAGANRLRAELGLGDTAVVALYAGAMGEKQGVETLIGMAPPLAAAGVALVLAGAGAARPRLEAALAGQAGVHLLPVQPVERLNELLGLADIHLLPQRADAADLVMPSKLTGMLASGRPVVAGAAPGTELHRAVAACGIAVPPGDAAAMARAVLDLAGDPVRRIGLGLAARARALADWDREAILGRVEAQMRAIVAP
jgi:colanic acid biosynthesis glycosyl transferase WcaI